jgi:hypothetical protein
MILAPLTAAPSESFTVPEIELVDDKAMAAFSMNAEKIEVRQMDVFSMAISCHIRHSTPIRENPNLRELSNSNIRHESWFKMLHLKVHVCP